MFLFVITSFKAVFFLLPKLIIKMGLTLGLIVWRNLCNMSSCQLSICFIFNVALLNEEIHRSFEICAVTIALAALGKKSKSWFSLFFRFALFLLFFFVFLDSLPFQRHFVHHCQLFLKLVSSTCLVWLLITALAVAACQRLLLLVIPNNSIDCH